MLWSRCFSSPVFFSSLFFVSMRWWCDKRIHTQRRHNVTEPNVRSLKTMSENNSFFLFWLLLLWQLLFHLRHRRRSQWNLNTFSRLRRSFVLFCVYLRTGDRVADEPRATSMCNQIVVTGTFRKPTLFFAVIFRRSHSFGFSLSHNFPLLDESRYFVHILIISCSSTPVFIPSHLGNKILNSTICSVHTVDFNWNGDDAVCGGLETFKTTWHIVHRLAWTAILINVRCPLTLCSPICVPIFLVKMR